MEAKVRDTESNNHGNHSENHHNGIVAVIPAYNEERFIGSVVLQTQKWADQVCVVDDGSLDTTAEIAEAAGAIVIRHEQNQGKGAALNTGLSYAQQLDPEIVVTLDADGQHLPEEMNAVAAPIIDGKADIVVGSRYIEKRSKVPFHRILGHLFFNYVTGSASGVHLSDSQSGFRAFSNRAFKSIRFRSNSFSVESEMQFQAFEKNLKMMEVPITIQYRDKPKRSVLIHGLIVLNGIMHLVGQYRPLLFFGLSGVVLMVISLALTLQVVEAYHRFQMLPLALTFITVILGLGGMLALFTGIILHSVRGLLLNLVEPKGENDTQGSN